MELLSDEAIIELLNRLSDMIKNVNGMLALRLKDMSNRRMVARDNFRIIL